MPEDWKGPIQDVMAWIGLVMAIGGLLAILIRNMELRVKVWRWEIRPVYLLLRVSIFPLTAIWWILAQIFGPGVARIGEWMRAGFAHEVAEVIQAQVPAIVHDIVEEHMAPIALRTEQLMPNGGSSLKDQVTKLGERMTKFETRLELQTEIDEQARMGFIERRNPNG